MVLFQVTGTDGFVINTARYWTPIIDTQNTQQRDKTISTTFNCFDTFQYESHTSKQIAGISLAI